jgi:hypothetical protein
VELPASKKTEDQVRQNNGENNESKHRKKVNVKVKVKLSLGLTKNHVMKTYGGVQI